MDRQLLNLMETHKKLIMKKVMKDIFLKLRLNIKKNKKLHNDLPFLS